MTAEEMKVVINEREYEALRRFGFSDDEISKKYIVAKHYEIKKGDTVVLKNNCKVEKK